MQGVSAVDQYVEAIPTSSGPRPTSHGGGQPRSLPAPVASKIRAQAGDDADALTEVATSPTYGAPARPIKPSETNQPAPEALGSEVSPAADAQEWRLGALLALLSLMTAATVGFAALQRRRASR